MVLVHFNLFNFMFYVINFDKMSIKYNIKLQYVILHIKKKNYNITIQLQKVLVYVIMTASFNL